MNSFGKNRIMHSTWPVIEFGTESRNIRFALSTNGMNSFGKKQDHA
jgi:hypothetical protein